MVDRSLFRLAVLLNEFESSAHQTINGGLNDALCEDANDVGVDAGCVRVQKKDQIH